MMGARTQGTFLFTDIEGSTRLWEGHPDEALGIVEQHDRIIEAAVDGHGGRIFHRAGDGVIARFASPTDAVTAAVEAQRELGTVEWGTIGELRVRMGVHTGEIVERDDGPHGWALNFGARMSDVGHGGQILLSAAAVEAIGELDGVSSRSLGEHRLRDVAEPADVYQLLADGLGTEFPPLRNTVSAVPTLPRPLTSLIGRDADVEAVLQSIDASRHVTVTGPPGIGTTRVVLAAAGRLADESDETVYWCDLADVAPGAVADAVATSLGVTTRRGHAPLDAVAAWVARRVGVLVLDCADATRTEIGELVSHVLAAAPSTSVLCAAQRRLGTQGERVHRLAPLSPETAVELFLTRAAEAGGTGFDRSTAREICDMLDGMPYGIEIVAANTTVFSPRELRDEVRAEGLGAVSDGEADAVDRAIALAVDTLDASGRAALVAATAMNGPFDRNMFGAVAVPDSSTAAVTATLADLVDRSLVQRDHGSAHATFRVLGPVRAVIDRKADRAQVDAARGRLRDHAMSFVDEVAIGLRGPEESRWARRFERQVDTIRSAFDDALDSHDFDAAVAISTALWEWGFMRFNSEYFGWGRRVLDVFDGDPRLGPVHGVVALGAWLGDDLDLALRHANRALELESQGSTFSLPARLTLVNGTIFSGADAPPPDIYREVHEYHVGHEQLYHHVYDEAQNAVMATWMGMSEVAERRGLDAVRLAHESGNATSISFALWALGTAIEADDPIRADSLLTDALDRARDVGNRWVVTLVQASLASMRRRLRGPVDTAPLLLDLVEQLARAGHRSQLWNAIRLCGLVAADTGADDLAVQLFARAEMAHLAWPPLPADAADERRITTDLTERHGADWLRRNSSIASTWNTTATVEIATGMLRGTIGAPAA